MRTTARLDEGEWVIDGSKSFIIGMPRGEKICPRACRCDT